MSSDEDFFDVTIACDDDQIQAHKVILSARSLFFRNNVRRIVPERVELNQISSLSVVYFMYHGEVSVSQEELKSFFSVAEDLKGKGLTQNQSGSQSTRKENDFKSTFNPK